MHDLRLSEGDEVSALLFALDHASKSIDRTPYQPLYLRIDDLEEESEDGEITVELDDDEHDAVAEAIEVYREEGAPTDDEVSLLDDIEGRL